ncbi:hypothetical protein CRYPA_1692 [uncultured Candidatus Thioglobus sp.]|nr:hypothetical protein CRYPA_1692 [uncultured Candidatus Thioglobus sp.]
MKAEIENIPDSTIETAPVEVTTDIDFLNEIGVETIDP